MLLTVVLEKTSESPLDCKEIKPVKPNGNQSWIFIGKTDAEAETPILWPPDANSWLIWKDPDAGKDWRLEEKGMTEDEMFGWHPRLNGHEFEQAPGVVDGQGNLVIGSLRNGHDWGTELNLWKRVGKLEAVLFWVFFFFFACFIFLLPFYILFLLQMFLSLLLVILYINING